LRLAVTLRNRPHLGVGVDWQGFHGALAFDCGLRALGLAGYAGLARLTAATLLTLAPPTAAATPATATNFTWCAGLAGNSRGCRLTVCFQGC